MDKTRIILTAVMTALCLNTMAQAKKPTLMVVPSEEWCNRHNYVKVFDNQGDRETAPDYKAALQGDADLNSVIVKIGALMADRGFPLQDLQQAVNQVTTRSAEERLIMSKNSGASIQESAYDQIRRRAKADILMKVSWDIETMGPKKSVRFVLSGIDAYSNKQVAAATGTGAPSFSATTALLLEEAVQNHLDNFAAQLQKHFDDMFENGREVALKISVFENPQGIDLEKEYNGEELSEIIDNWMAQNTVNHRFSKVDASENYAEYNQVRIPLYRTNGMPQDTEGFARQLDKFLRTAPYNIPVKVIARGLGECILVLGDK